jgi:hypothetical protein
MQYLAIAFLQTNQVKIVVNFLKKYFSFITIQTLTELDIGSNNICADGMQYLAAVLKQNKV